MKTILFYAAIFAMTLASAAGQAKVLTTDPSTGLPLIPASDPGTRMGNLAMTYNQPTEMPGSQVCKSKEQGVFYSLYKIKVDEAAAWYASHLSGFKKVEGYDSHRTQIVFYNSDRTIVVIVTGSAGAEGENTNAYSVAYEKYQPGLSEKTIAAMPQGNVDCR